MTELKCPHCGQAFTVDDTELSFIIQQIRDKEFEKDLTNRVSENWDHDKDTENKVHDEFILSGRGGNASGYPLDDNFVVVAGSKISKDVTEGFQDGYLELRESLMKDGTISNGVFVKDYLFSSSSAAAAVVLGRAANGRKEWTLLDGRTYGK
ncbi:MAG: DUF4357 domain-containing protein [Lachnospiraceae bacterium]|nr:DUF4357 domain-containing protein [Lachnospiraceae bacterium]